MNIRNEVQVDIEKVYFLNEAAFETNEEANIVNTLREKVEGVISLVATKEDEVVGHIMFSPVDINGVSGKIFYGLAPMAVSPSCQNKGIGSLLVEAGLKACKAQNISAVFVLGHPNYYPRFGFTPTTRFAIKSEYDVPDDVFMALELQAGSLREVNGILKYSKVFGSV